MSSTDDLESRISVHNQPKHHEDVEKKMDVVKIVCWDDTDPAHPRNMPVKRKVMISAINCTMALITMMSVSVMTPAVPDIVRIFKSTNTIGSLTYSVFVLGWAVAPMILAPLSEIYGRRNIYISCWVLFICGFSACALAPNMAALLAFRFLAGLAGAPAITLNAGTVTDLWDVEQQGIAIGMIVIVSYLGPLLGPIAGGYIAQYASWRWTLWLTVLMAGTLTPAVFWSPETHATTILAGQVHRRRFTSGDMLLRAEGQKSMDLSLFKTTMAKPFKMLFTEPIIFLVATYIGVISGILYLYFGAYPFVFRKIYRLSQGDSSLAFLGLTVGCLLAAPTASIMAKYYMKRRIARNNVGLPEDRLPWALGAAVAAPIGMFWFAWTGKEEIHYIVPILGGVPFGWATLVLMISQYTYLADSYHQKHAASVFASIIFLRSIMTAAFPVFMPTMYENLGAPWATSLLGFLTVACIPIPFCFYHYGARLRTRSPFACLQ